MNNFKSPSDKLNFINNLFNQLVFITCEPTSVEPNLTLVFEHLEANNKLSLTYNIEEKEYQLDSSSPTVESERSEEIRLTALIEVTNLIAMFNNKFPDYAINLFANPQIIEIN